MSSLLSRGKTGSSSGLSSLLGGGGIGRTHAAVGLDLGSHNIKAAALRDVDGRIRVDKLHSLPVPPAMVAGSEILDAEGLTEEIVRLFDEAGLRRIRSTIAVGGSDVFIRRVTMPRMSYQDALKEIPNNRNIRLPVEIRNNKLDLFILDPNGEDSSMHALVVAAKKESISLRQKVVMEAGSLIHAVDVDAFALYNIFAHCHPEAAKERVTLLDIGHETTLVVVLDRGFPSVARQAYIGVSHLLERLTSDNMMSDEAEQVIQGDNPPAIYQEAFRGWTEQILDEVKRSAASISRGDSTTGPLHLSGGGALIDGFPIFFRDRAGIQVSVFNPLVGLDKADDIDLGHPDGAALYAMAIGLGLRQVG